MVKFVVTSLFVGILLYCHPAQAQRSVSDFILGQVPACKTLYVRNAYALCYDSDKRIPLWVAYKVSPDDLKTPPRKGKFQRFNDDPDICNEPHRDEYTGLLASNGYARGHLAPYEIMGGDRDGDGLYAADGDEDDIQTVIEGNYMSNIAPQIHTAFNGSGGLWFKLERWIQDTLINKQGRTVWVYAGSINVLSHN